MKHRRYQIVDGILSSRCHPPSSPVLGRQRSQDASNRTSSAPTRPGSSFVEMEIEFQRKVAEDDRRCLLPRPHNYQASVAAQAQYERFEREQEERKRTREAREEATRLRRAAKAEERRLARRPKPKHVWRDGEYSETGKKRSWMNHPIGGTRSAVDPVVWADGEYEHRLALYSGEPIFMEGFEHLPKNVREAVDLAFVMDNAAREEALYRGTWGWTDKPQGIVRAYHRRTATKRMGARYRGKGEHESQRA